MSQRLNYLLPNAFNISLNTIFTIITFYLIYCILKLIIQQTTNENMSITSKKRKRLHNRETNQETVFKRGIIDANWQKLLSSTLMEKKDDKPVNDIKKEHFTGTFRRARMKKNKDIGDVKNTMPVVSSTSENEKPNVNDRNSKKITKFLAMDCEMVGIGYGGEDHMLARVSIVNKFGDCIYDKFVKAREEVVNYRTDVSGIRKEDLLNGETFETVQKEVAELIQGKILVGHSLKNDLGVLFLSHPKRKIRDTSRYKPFRKITKGSTPSLKRLAKEILGIDIQHGEHSSVEDAKAAMQLYCTVAKAWEQMY